MKIINLKYSIMITDDHDYMLTMQPWLIGCIKGHQRSKMMTTNVVL